ncbi:DUF2829 domain-containing protein [Streptomyces sp. NPDC047070]|uniref:DUF2829 domain-containing protein n=1 Tax=Streptomyces sp. NPDC047070 TaxID=3154923 RepID=UPI0034519A91
MDIGEAIKAAKAGARVARTGPDGWSESGAWVVYQAGYPDGIAINANTARATGIPEGTVRAFSPYLMLHTADGTFVPWTISQSDALAEDWAVVPCD